MLHLLLIGRNRLAHERLLLLWESLKDRTALLWYPSAGIDFRDVTESSTLHRLTGDSPNLYIHTDYQLAGYALEANTTILHYPEGAFFKNSNTLPLGAPTSEVTIEAAFDLELEPAYGESYCINPEYADNAVDAPTTPSIKLLDVSFFQNGIRNTATVLYFGFENINFLEHILLKHHIKIPFFLKVREGCGFGGNRKSITVALGLLSLLGTQFVISDDEGDCDYHLWTLLNSQYGEAAQSYSLEKMGSIKPLWSTLNVSIYRVVIANYLLSASQLAQNIAQLRVIDWEAYSNHS